MKEIGSDFHFPVKALVGRRRCDDKLSISAPNTVVLGSGRDALYWIISALGLPAQSQVLLPAYLCEDVVNPFVASGHRVSFYRITSDLKVDAADLAEKLCPETRIVLYINYFGFPAPVPAAVVESAAPETVFVQDASHSFLSCQDNQAINGEIQFASYRKLLPVPDGGFVSWDTGHLSNINRVRTRWSLERIGALTSRCTGGVLKGIWLQLPGIYPKTVFRRLFVWSDALVDKYPKPAGMSAVSRYLLGRIDLEEVVQARRRNFQFLLDCLKDHGGLRPLYTALPEGVCPLGFPVLAESRDELARHLIQHRVYPPIHWELPEMVDQDAFPEAWSISRNILTLPVDQRYGLRDMARIVDAINAYEPRKVQWHAGR